MTLQYKPVPEAAEFSTKYVVVPDLLKVFTSHVHLPDLQYPFLRFKEGSYVERGDVLISIHFGSTKQIRRFIPGFLKRNENALISIRSPVSGLLFRGNPDINSSDHEERDVNHQQGIKLLMKQNEPSPEGPEFMFRDVCDYYWNNRDRLRTERPGSLEHSALRNDELLKRQLNRQLGFSCPVVTIQGDDVEYILEIIQLYPELLPRLKHLVD